MGYRDFFHPTDAFLDWLAARYGEESGRYIIDVGCGTGLLLEKMIKRDIRALGIEIHPYKYQDCEERFGRAGAAALVMQGDATEHPIVRAPEAVLLFARPCHSDWIVKTVKRAVRPYSPDRGALYISKPGNAECDLEGLQRVRRCVGMEIGSDGEECWEVFPMNPDYSQVAHRMCLVRHPSYDPVFEWTEWKQDRGDRWGHHLEGFTWMRKSEGDVVLREAFVNDENLLDYTLTSSWQRWDARSKDSSLMEGWVSPDGVFYRCGYHEHDEVIVRYLRRTVREVEEEGWCRVQRDTRDRRYLFTTAGRDGFGSRPHSLTREQVQALLDAGHTLPNYILDDSEGDWSHLMTDELDFEES